MKDFLFFSTWDIVRYDIQLNGKRAVLIQYFISMLLGIPLALFALFAWHQFSGALPLVIFFLGFVINFFTLFVIAFYSPEKKKSSTKRTRIWFHLWRAYVIFPFLILCPGVLPLLSFVEYIFFIRT